jgi:hypothetical protein
VSGNSYSGVPERAAPVEDARLSGYRGTRVHITGEEWTRVALCLLDRAPAGVNGAPGSDPPGFGHRPVVWELLPGKIVVGCEDGVSLGATAPAAGWSRRWTLQLDEAARAHDSVTSDRPSPEPRDAALVTVDVEPGRRVLVDLVAAGVTTLSGDQRDCDALVHRFAAEIAERRWSPLYRLVLVGLPALAERVRVPGDAIAVDDLVALEELLSSEVDPISHPRRRLASGSKPAARATLVVVGPRAITDIARLDQLVALAAEHDRRAAGHHGADVPSAVASLTGGSGQLSVVVGSPWPGARCMMAVSQGGARADVFLRPTLSSTDVPTRSETHERHSSGEALTAIATEVVDEICAEAARVVEEGPSSGSATGTATGRAQGAPRGGSAEGVEVAVLGRVEVRGVEGSLARRPKLTELVVFLALHPGGATTGSWATALWPGRRVPPQTVANRLSEARRLLGVASDDRSRLRRSGDLHLLAEVSTDWGRFQQLAHHSRGTDSWREALGLVRGRPFEDLPSGLWTALECTAVEIERTVTECALRCGEQLLADGDPEGAAWAAHQGLRTCPWDERLHRLLMITADATGNRAGVEATLRHLALVLEVDGDPLRYVHPETAALYARLVGKSPSTRS